MDGSFVFRNFHMAGNARAAASVARCGTAPKSLLSTLSMFCAISCLRQVEKAQLFIHLSLKGESQEAA